MRIAFVAADQYSVAVVGVSARRAGDRPGRASLAGNSHKGTRAQLRVGCAAPTDPCARPLAAPRVIGLSVGPIRSQNRHCGQGRIYGSLGLRPLVPAVRLPPDTRLDCGAAGPTSIILDNGAYTGRVGCPPDDCARPRLD